MAMEEQATNALHEAATATRAWPACLTRKCHGRLRYRSSCGSKLNESSWNASKKGPHTILGALSSMLTPDPPQGA